MNLGSKNLPRMKICLVCLTLSYFPSLTSSGAGLPRSGDGPVLTTVTAAADAQPSSGTDVS